MTTSLIVPTSSAVTLSDRHQDQVNQALEDSHSPSTRRAYSASWKVFTEWCQESGYPALPADPSNVAAFLADQAEAGKKKNTLGTRKAAIRFFHEKSGLADPTAHPGVRQTLKGLRRQKASAGERPAPKSAARGHDVQTMVSHADRDTVAGKRDAAMLLFGFASAMRRSELAALQVEDLVLTEEGLQVRINRSKTDQEGKGRTLAVPFESRSLYCPARALLFWLQASGVTSGQVFRAVDRSGHVRPTLSSQMVARIVKKYAARAGFDPKNYAGHSLRRGHVTSAKAAGKSNAAIRNQGGWADDAMPNHYTEDAGIWEDNSASGLLA